MKAWNLALKDLHDEISRLRDERRHFLSKNRDSVKEILNRSAEARQSYRRRFERAQQDLNRSRRQFRRSLRTTVASTLQNHSFQRRLLTQQIRREHAAFVRDNRWLVKRIARESTGSRLQAERLRRTMSKTRRHPNLHAVIGLNAHTTN